MKNDYPVLQQIWDLTNKGKPLDIEQVAILADGILAIYKNKTQLPAEIDISSVMEFLKQYELKQWSSKDAATYMTNGILTHVIAGFNNSIN